MAETFQEAIVLKIDDLNEKESIVTFLTSDGKLSLLALGLQKPVSKNKFNLQIGSIVELEFFQARLKGNIGRLKKSTTLLTADTTTYFNSLLIQKLIKIFNLVNVNNNFLLTYKEAIEKIGFGKNSYILTFFTNMLLKYLGIKPNFFNCVICHSNENLVEFEFYKGGFFCQWHSQLKMEVSLLESYYFLETSFESFYEKTTPKNNKEIYLKLLSYLNDNGIYINWEKASRIEK